LLRGSSFVRIDRSGERCRCTRDAGSGSRRYRRSKRGRREGQIAAICRAAAIGGVSPEVVGGVRDESAQDGAHRRSRRPRQRALRRSDGDPVACRGAVLEGHCRTGSVSVHCAVQGRPR